MREKTAHLQLLFIVIMFSFMSFPFAHAQDSFPGSSWDRATPASAGFDEGRLASAVSAYAANASDPHDLLIAKGGKVVLETARYPYRTGVPHTLMSCTKSVISALIGIAIEERKISGVEAPLSTWFPEIASDPKKAGLRLKHLLTMTSGLAWREDGSYDGEDSYMRMLGSEDPVGYYFGKESRNAPGTAFYYNSGSSFILSVILQKATGMTAEAYARTRLFAPIGVNPYFWQRHSSGYTIGGSGLYLTPRDMARFGLLYARGGNWRGIQVVPSWWVRDSTRKQVDTPSGLAGRNGYGYQWWMNQGEGFSARGFGGQYILVYPARDLVIVTTGGMFRNDFFFPDTVLGAGTVASLGGTAAADKALARAINSLEAVPKPGRNPLPPVAKAVSGKRYRFEDGSALTLDFSRGNRSAGFLWEVNGNILDLSIPIDGTYREADLKGFGALPANLAAISGTWRGTDAFELSLRRYGIAYEYRYRFTFEGDGALWEGFASYMSAPFETYRGER